MLDSNVKPLIKPDEGHRRPQMTETDIFMPAPASNFSDAKAVYAHRGREKNTNFSQAKFNKRQEYMDLRGGAFQARELERSKKEYDNIKDNARGDIKRYERHIKERFNKKLEQVEVDVERRRYLLINLLAEEEKEYVKEAIYIAQEGDTTKFQRMQTKYNELGARRELERQQYVHEKRILQYALRCAELRPLITQKQLIQTKNSQLQQMRDNEARRQHEKEMDNMWLDVAIKRDEALLEREKQEAISRHNRSKEDDKIRTQQIEGKKLMIAQEREMAKENLVVLKKQYEQLLQDQHEEIMTANRKKETSAQELFEQIQARHVFMEQRKKEEIALEQAFTRLSQLEIEKEQAKISDTKSQEKRETELYLQYLRDLKHQRNIDDIKLTGLLEEYQKKAREEQEQVTCAEKERKREMTQKCVRQLAEQVKAKRLEAEENLRKQQEENNTMLYIIKKNNELFRESQNIANNITAKYKHDLRKQVEYNKLLKQRETIELEKQLKAGMVEEEKYMKIVNDLISMDLHGELSFQKQHAFRKILEQSDCFCSKDNNVP